MFIYLENLLLMLIKGWTSLNIIAQILVHKGFTYSFFPFSDTKTYIICFECKIFGLYICYINIWFDGMFARFHIDFYSCKIASPPEKF